MVERSTVVEEEAEGGGRARGKPAKSLNLIMLHIVRYIVRMVVWYYLRGLGTLCVLSIQVYTCISVT